MISRFVNRELKTVTAAAVIIAFSTLASKVVGLVRDRVFAHYFGAGVTMDAYYAAFKIPDLIYGLLIAGALTAGFIPTFSKLFFSKEDKSDAWKLANNILSITGVLLALIALFGIIFTKYLSALIAPGFSGPAKELVIQFTRIMFLSPFFLGISMVLGGILQSLKQFIIYSFAPITYNLGIIFGATVLCKTALGITGLAWGVVLGSALHALVQMYGAYHNGWRFRFSWLPRDPNTLRIATLMIPRTLALGVTQLNAVIITILASYLAHGSITVFNLAINLQAVPVSLIGIPFGIAVFPALSEAVAKKDWLSFSNHLTNTLKTIFFLIAPACVLILLLRAQMIRVVYGSGAFGWDATIATANVLGFFALGLIGQAFVPTLVRAFYAFSNTKTPFFISIGAEAVCLVASLLLMKPLGVVGLAAGDALGDICNAALLLIFFAAFIKYIDLSAISKTVWKVTVASIAMGVVVQLTKYPLARVLDQRYFWGIFGQGVIAGGAGLIIYFLISYLLKVPEMTLVLGTLEKRWLRLRNIPVGLDEAEKI